MRPTEQFVEVLSGLKAGALGLLRMHAGRDLDDSVDGFDLFAGLWWPLRQESARAPRREVAWLVAKLYARHALPHSPGKTLASQLGLHQPARDPARARFRRRFDRLLGMPLGRIEPALQWALDLIDQSGQALDWVRLIDDLSVWERDATRLRWAEEFLRSGERSE